MRKLFLASVVCLGAGLFLAAGESFQPLNVKTGLWETTMVSSMSGMPPLPPEVLEKMTPEQRARMEAMMGKSGGQSNTYKSCLTKEKLTQNPFNDKRMESCTQKVISSSGSKMDVHMVCDQNGAKMDMTVHIEAPDSEHSMGKVKSDVTGNGHAMSFNGTFKSKWLGADCGDVK